MGVKGWIGLSLFLGIIMFSFIGPQLAPHSFDYMTLEDKNLPPSLKYWFGTDDLGRNLFARVANGTRISLFIAISAAVIDMVIGVIWGTVAAFSGRLIDTAMMHTADILCAVPQMLLVIIVMMILGQGLHSLLIAMTVTGWITMSRIVRGHILMLKEQEFVLASRALGGHFWHIFFYHLLPNTAPIILVTLTFTIPSAIFTEAFIGFLGLSDSSSCSSLGTLVNDSLPALAYYPWRLFFPATFICLTMFSLQLIGEELNNKTKAIRDEESLATG